jgi:hypothetical protein
MKTIKLLSISFVVLAMCLVSLKTQAQDNWRLDQTMEGIDFYHQIAQCNGDSVVFLKFVNSNSHNVSITWTEVFDTQTETGVLGFRGTRQIILTPGTTLQVDCADTNHPECLIVALDVTPTHKVVIRSFAFANITVVNLQ